MKSFAGVIVALFLGYAFFMANHTMQWGWLAAAIGAIIVLVLVFRERSERLRYDETRVVRNWGVHSDPHEK